MGLLLILALAGAAIAIAATQKSGAKPSDIPATTMSSDQTAQLAAYAQIPAGLVPRFVEAIRSGNAQTAYAVAAWFRAQGYTHAADVLTQAANSVAPPAAPAVPSAPSPLGTVPAQPAQAPSAGLPSVPAPSAPHPEPSAAPSVVLPSMPPATPPGSVVLPGMPPAQQAAVPPAAQPPAGGVTPPAPWPDLPIPAIPVPTAPATPTTPTQPATPPGQDPPLPPAIQTLLENVLRTAHDPTIIYQTADMLQANGFPRTAAELRKRAIAIASSQVDPIAIIQDILHHADQNAPPAPTPTAPAIPPGAMPQYPSSTTPPQFPWSIPGVTPQGAPAVPPGASTPTAPTSVPVPVPGMPGIAVNIPTQINLPGLSIPGFTTPQVPAPAPAPGTRYYVVESGDNPSKIAKKFTGDPNRWREMASLNPEANLAAGKIHPGQRLRVPPAWPNSAAAGPVVPIPMPSLVPTAPSSPTPAATAGGYDPNLARSLAPQVLQDVAANGDKYNREQLKTFQRAAGLSPDGEYGPRAAGAVEYFASASAPPSLPKYGSGTKPYAPPRSTPPLKPGGSNA